MRARVVFWTVAMLSLVPGLLLSKGNTIRIVIRGGQLSTPIEITDPAILNHFNVWSGPGTSSNESEGLNVDWPRGVAHPSKDLETYIVSFVTTRSNPSAYVVLYKRDAATKQGYVYIPGKADASYRDNVWLIYRGTEGNWFYASKAWQDVADPLITRRYDVR